MKNLSKYYPIAPKLCQECNDNTPVMKFQGRDICRECFDTYCDNVDQQERDQLGLFVQRKGDTSD